MSFGTEDRNDIGQVVLALCVIALHMVDGIADEVPVEHVDPTVDLRDLAFPGGRVGVLHDPLDPIPSVPHHPSVTGRIGHTGG